MTGTGSAEYRRGIDGVRAIAVSAVLVFHLGRLSGGNLGVDAFFVVSGWLITWRLLAEVERNGTIRLARFWGARARRLMPASLAVLATVAVVWPLAGIAVPSLRRDIVWAAGWASNWGTIVGGGDYWSRFGEPSPVTHFWSLAIEEQFYLVWPLVIVAAVAVSRRPRVAVGVFSAVAAVASIVVMNVMFDATDPTATYMNTFARAHSLLIGAAAGSLTIVLADGQLRGGSMARRVLPVAALGALAIVGWSRDDSTWLFDWGLPAFALCTVVVVVAVADGAGERVLASPPMCWLADRSYGLYLWHWPVFLLLSPSRLGLPDTLLADAGLDVVRVGVAVVLADVSFRFLESPIRGRRRLVQWKAPAAAGLAMATVLALAFVVVPRPVTTSTDRVVALPPLETPQRRTEAIPPTDIVEAPGPGEPATGVQTPSSPLASGVRAPWSPLATGPLRVLVTGDSTGVQLSTAVLDYASSVPGQLVAGSAAFGGCGLSAAADGRLHEFTNVDGDRELIDLRGCGDQWAAVSQRVVDESVDVVVVSIGPWDAVDIHLPDGAVVAVDDPRGAALVADAYRGFVDEIRSTGAAVVWVMPADSQLGWGSIDDPVNRPARWVALRSIIDDLGVTEIDLPGWLAARGIEGPDGRPDGIHLTAELNRRLVEEELAPMILLTQPGYGSVPT